MEWSQTHYNLIVNSDQDAAMFRNSSGVDYFPADRLFGYTSPDLKAKYQSDLSSLSEMPVLAVAELFPGTEPRPAFVGRIDQVRMQGASVRFRFEHLFDRFTAEEVFQCGYFDIDDRSGPINETNRTHWAVKEGNLMEGVLRLLEDQPRERCPGVFRIDPWPLPSLGHIAVMMPFDSAFSAVYEAIKTSCANLSLQTLRVDEIYGPTAISNDIFTTIEQSKLVVSDLTGRNPNVLYETGLAHARDRDVIMIVQNVDDVPFDLRHLRYIKYLPNQEGLENLVTELENSILSII